MKEEEIIKGNKLIAIFMEYQILHKKYQYRNFNSSNESYFDNAEGEIVCDKNGREVNLYPDGDQLDDFSELPFHSSWNWLMPVVEKIESLDFHTAIIRSKPNRYLMHIYNFYDLRNAITTKGDSKIQVIYENVIKFINWYNKRELHESK